MMLWLLRWPQPELGLPQVLGSVQPRTSPCDYSAPVGDISVYTPIETYRGFVYPSVIDNVGHMNVQSYTGRFDEATWQFLAHLGLTPSFLKRNQRGAVAVDHHTQYRREVLAGSLLHITTQLVALGRTSIRLVHRMYDSETGEEVATTALVGVYFDLERRAPTPLPTAVHRRATELRAARADVVIDSSGDTEEMLAVK